jgi:hypothetical protein
MGVRVIDRRRILVIGADFAEGRSSVVVRLQDALDGLGFKVVAAEEVKLHPPILPMVRPVALPAPQPLTYGPQRKGKGGKPRRW